MSSTRRSDLAVDVGDRRRPASSAPGRRRCGSCSAMPARLPTRWPSLGAATTSTSAPAVASATDDGARGAARRRTFALTHRPRRVQPRPRRRRHRSCCCCQAPAPPPTGDLLDLGCGAGPIALTLARRAPDATVWAVDVNERARDAVRRQRRGERHRQRRASPRPDDVPGDVRFAAIWSNPPIRIGKAALHELLLALARPPDARRRGAPRRAQAPRRRLAAALARPTQGWPTPSALAVGARATASCASPALTPPTERPRPTAGAPQQRAGGRRRRGAGRPSDGRWRPGAAPSVVPVGGAHQVTPVGAADRRPRRRPAADRRTRRARRRSTAASAPIRRQPEQLAALPPPARAAGPGRRCSTACEHLVVRAGTSAPAAARPRSRGPTQPGGAHQQGHRLLGGPVARREQLGVEVEEGDDVGVARPGGAPPRCRRRRRPSGGGSSVAAGDRDHRPAGGGLELLAQPGDARAQVGERRRPAALADRRARRVPQRRQRSAPSSAWATAASHRSQRSSARQARQASSRARPAVLCTQTTRRAGVAQVADQRAR